MTAEDLWKSTWNPSTHETEYAQKRIKSAKSAKLTPIKIDIDDMYGYFQGSHGKYETWLNTCPCGDFRRSRLPCKHIYRLAMELGVFQGDYKSDASFIPSVRSEQFSLADTVSVIESLSENAQKLLLGIALSTSTAMPNYSALPSQELTDLINSGIVCKRNGMRDFNYGNANELKRNLKSLNLDYDKKMKIDQLKKYCTDNYPDQMATVYDEMIVVYIPDYYIRRNVHFYLHRKWDYSYDYGCPVIKTTLPEDAITKELIKRGYYNPDKTLDTFTISLEI